MAFSTINFKGTAGDWNEITLGVAEAKYYPLAEGGAETKSDRSIDSILEKKSLLLMDDGPQLLSRLYPSAIFYLNSEYDEPEFIKGTVWCGGEQVRHKESIKRQSKMLEMEVLRFSNNNKYIAEGVCHRAEIMPSGRVAIDGENRFGECNVLLWEDISEITCGNWHTAAITKSGRVISCGSNANGQCKTDDINSAIQLSAGRYHTAVLQKSGYVIVASNNEKFEAVNEWKDVKKIISICESLFGITDTGKILFAGEELEVDAEIYTHLLSQ